MNNKIWDRWDKSKKSMDGFTKEILAEIKLSNKEKKTLTDLMELAIGIGYDTGEYETLETVGQLIPLENLENHFGAAS